MQPVRFELLARALLQSADHLLDVVMVSPEDEVAVLGEDAARVHVVPTRARDPGKPFGNAERLLTGENDGRVLQRLFRREALGAVVRVVRVGPVVIDLGRGALAEQVPRPDEVRPRAPRVIRQPEPVHPVDDVVGNDDEAPPRNGTGRAS